MNTPYDSYEFPHRSQRGVRARHLQLHELSLETGEQCRVWRSHDDSTPVIVTVHEASRQQDQVLLEEPDGKKVWAPLDIVAERLTDRQYVWSPLEWLEPEKGETLELLRGGNFRFGEFTGERKKNEQNALMLVFTDPGGGNEFFAHPTNMARRLEPDEFFVQPTNVAPRQESGKQE